MAKSFPGRQEKFFFRSVEQNYIEQRLKRPGITAIRGRPRSGKSWLNGQVLRRVSESSPNTLIGFTRCSLQDDDSLIRVIDDLYLRWFENASLIDQAKRKFDQHQGRWLPVVANAIGGLLETTQLLGPGSGVASSALKKLASENGLTMHVPHLKYEEGLQFVSALATISEADRVILALDSWEQSANISYQAEHLREFVRNPDEWINTHFLISVEANSEADNQLQSIGSGVRPWVEIYDLPQLDIENAPQEKERLASYLRAIVPACRTAESNDDFLCFVDGYPDVIDNWTRPGAPARLTTLEDLHHAAREARLGRYPEFDEKLPSLDAEARRLCIRLALLPYHNEDQWFALRPILTNDVSDYSLDLLAREALLEDTNPPTFGHSTRSTYLITWLVRNGYNECRSECIALIRAFARKIQTINSDIGPFVNALIALSYPARNLKVDGFTYGLCEAACGLSSYPIDGEFVVETAKELKKNSDPDSAALVAMGLFNSLSRANSEESSTDPEVFLDELRSLQSCYPENSQVRECLARAYFKSSNYAGSAGGIDRCEKFLDELHALHGNYPSDNEVRHLFAFGLSNSLKYAKSAGGSSRGDNSLNKLRLLAQQFPDDAITRSAFASALVDKVSTMMAEPLLRNKFVDELRILITGYADDSAIHESLTRALLIDLIFTNQMMGPPDKKDALLLELRCIQQKYPANTEIRGFFAEAMLSSIIAAAFLSDVPRRDALRLELSALHETYPDDEKVREIWEQRYPPAGF